MVEIEASGFIFLTQYPDYLALSGHNRALNIFAPDWSLHFNSEALTPGNGNADNIESCGKT
jgi:hypothetical protein